MTKYDDQLAELNNPDDQLAELNNPDDQLAELNNPDELKWSAARTARA